MQLTYAYTADELFTAQEPGFPLLAFMNGINEWGVSLSSNCFDSRDELGSLEGGLGWPEIGKLCMERCKTAREAVELVAWIFDKYHFLGFGIPGSGCDCKDLAFFIADANEGWIIEATPHHFVARRCPMMEPSSMRTKDRQIQNGTWHRLTSSTTP